MKILLRHKRKMFAVTALVLALSILMAPMTSAFAAELDKLEMNGTTFYYEPNGNECTIVSVESAASLVTVPDFLEQYMVTKIGDKAFAGNKTIKSVIISQNVSVIGNEAFQSCSNLVNVLLPSDIQTIGTKAFANTGLKKIYIPAGIKSVASDAFEGTVYAQNAVAKPTATPKPVAKDSVTATGVNYPTKINKGSAFGLKGTIKVTGQYNTVTGYILDESGREVMKVTDSIKNGTYNIAKGKVNYDLVFNKVPVGTFTYKVVVTGAGSADYTVVDKKFTVVAAPKPTATPKPTEAPTPAATPEPTPEPTPELKVEQRKVSVTVPLNVAVNTDPNSEYEMLASDIFVDNTGETDIAVSIHKVVVDSEHSFVEEDGLPNDKDWDDLSKRLSKKYLALGVIANRGWSSIETKDATYLTEDLEDSFLGIVSPETEASIFTQGFYGRGLEEPLDSALRIVFHITPINGGQ